MSEFLHRRHRVVIDLEADDFDELYDSLTRIADSIYREQLDQRELTSGGPGSGYHFTLTTDREMTAERYRAYLSERPWRKAADA